MGGEGIEEGGGQCGMKEKEGRVRIKQWEEGG